MGRRSDILSVTLAIRELRYDWQSSFCFIAALVGVLAPLLILLALKNGVIGAMVDGLVENPANREVIPMGTAFYEQSFLADMAARPEVGFVIAAPRRINAAASALRNPVSRELERAVPLIPSAPGDPLLPDAQIVEGRVWLSNSLASDLNLDSGDMIEMLVGREIDGARETARAQFEVAGVAAHENYERQAMFMSLPDLLDVEVFRDDRAVTIEQYSSSRPNPERFASFRMYARDLADLPALLAALESAGVQARPRSENASLLLAFRDNLNFLYAAIAIIAVAGFWAAMAANLRGMVERQRAILSLLRLLGLPAGAVVRIPLLQGAVLVTTGVFVTLLIVLPSLFMINAFFTSPSGETVAKLGFFDVVGAIVLGLLTSASAATWSMVAVHNIKSDEVLRNG